MFEDKKRKRKVFEISSYEGNDTVFRKTVDMEELMKRFNKRMRGGGGLEEEEREGEYETMEGVPNEVAMMMMSFMSMKELITLGATSKTNRTLLSSLMGRSSERPYNMRLKKIRSSDTKFLLDRDCSITIDPNENEVLINDILIEDNPIRDMKLAISVPRIIFNSDGFYEVNRDNKSMDPISLSLSADDFAKDILLEGIASKIEGPVYHSSYGTVALTLPTSRRDLMRMTQRIGGENGMRRIYDTMDKLGFSIFTLMNYIKDGKSIWITRTCGLNYASFIDEGTIICSESWGEGKENTISIMDPSNGSILWRIGVEDKYMESACMSINRMILFSVIHPKNMKRTVFMVERGPKIEKAYHLHSIQKGGAIKRIAYERGTMVMLIGNWNVMGEYDHIVSLDILYGTLKKWKIKANASPFYITQAKGLQFQIDKDYFKVIIE